MGLGIWRAYAAFKRRLLRHRMGEAHILKRYQRVHGRPYDPARPPERLTEHVLARMLRVNRRGDATYARLTDKYAVRAYVRERVGDAILPGLIWSGGDPERIPFDTLPARCIVKCNNGSGRNVVVNGSLSREHIVRALSGWLKDDYYWIDHERHYSQIEPRIVIEEWLDDGHPDGPLDYKVWCFGGEPRYVQVNDRLHSINAFYTPDWVLQPFRYRDGQKDFDMPRPDNLESLLDVARRLSRVSTSSASTSTTSMVR